MKNTKITTAIIFISFITLSVIVAWAFDMENFKKYALFLAYATPLLISITIFHLTLNMQKLPKHK